MKIISIIPLKSGIFRGDLTYFTSQDVPIGSVVVVPIRKKKILGIVSSVQDASGSKMDIKGMNYDLRKVTEVKKRSIFTPEFLEVANNTSEYFLATGQSFLANLIPSIFLQKYDELELASGMLRRPAVSTNTKTSSAKNEKLLMQAPFEDRVIVYRTLIRGSFAQKKSVFIVLPAEKDIDAFYSPLSKGIEQFTIVLHSNMSPKKVLESIKIGLSTPHPILILATAPFLALARYDLGTIILEHESAGSYRMMSKPYVDLRIFTELFATKIGAKFITSDTLLRFETLSRRNDKHLLPMHPLSFRLNFSGEIVVENPRIDKSKNVIDKGSKTSRYQIFSDDTIEHMKAVVGKGGNVFVFALRKGLATQTVCKDCRDVLVCEECNTPAVLHYSRDRKKKLFVCNRCQRSMGSDSVCARCGGWNLLPLGIGTDTVVEELSRAMPKVRVYKLDKEVAKTKRGAQKIAKDFQSKGGSVLVGTEMALYYLVDKMPLSVIASFDSLWSIPSFRITEKILQLVISITSITDSKLIIETKNPNDTTLSAIKGLHMASFIEGELDDRRKLGYPPYKRFVKITHRGSKESTASARDTLKNILADYNPEIFSGFVAKEKGVYVTNALVKIDPKNWSLPELAHGAHIDRKLQGILTSLPPEYSVHVDPEDLL